ncbi:MAG: hypothetical protein M3270_00245 [Thermoproteota archaeon]|nr:hypothetical protein [Thermoproteota archaeon]
MYKKTREVFEVPEDYDLGIMIAIGHQGTYRVLPETKTKGVHTKRTKPLSEIVFIERIGNGIGIDPSFQ